MPNERPLVCHKLRTASLRLGLVLGAGGVGGVLPDLLDHGIIWSGRSAHLPCAIVGLSIVVGIVLWRGTHWALSGRFRVPRELVEVVE